MWSLSLETLWLSQCRLIFDCVLADWEMRRIVAFSSSPLPEGWWVRWVWVSVTSDLMVRFYENLVNTWRRWCSNTIGVSNSRLRVPLVVASIFQLGIHWVRDILIHLLYVNDFCKFDLWFGNTHKSEATSVGVCLLKRQHQHLLFALLNVRKGRGLSYGLSL